MRRSVSFQVGGAWLVLLASTAFAADDRAAVGEKLYSGGLPLTASIAGHQDAMPPGVVICTNCHAAPLGRPGSKPAAPDLRHGWLSEIRSRRNGPAGRYDQASFCRALRSGIDPVYVMLPIRMPRFTISDSDCEALWIFLEGKS